MIKPIYKVEVIGYCRFNELIRMLTTGNDVAIRLCRKYGVNPNSIRVRIIGPPLEDSDSAVIEFCVPGALYEHYERKKLESRR